MKKPQMFFYYIGYISLPALTTFLNLIMMYKY